MKKILVAVDGSEPSMKGARMAAELAQATGSTMILAYVVVPVALPADFYRMASVQIEDQLRKDGEAALEQATRTFSGVNLERTLLAGPAAEALADAAEAMGADLVVVGSRGRSAMARVLLGSVADRLVHVCKKPVLVVR